MDGREPVSSDPPRPRRGGEKGIGADPWADRESAPPRLRSRDLFGNARRVIIDHEGREYCLLITRQGKLILNRGS
jgi:hemin uptake protein HemP